MPANVTSAPELKAELARLEAGSWVDSQTRAVLLDVQVWNPTEQLVSVLKLQVGSAKALLSFCAVICCRVRAGSPHSARQDEAECEHGPRPLQVEFSVVGRVVAGHSLQTFKHKLAWQPSRFYW